MTQRVETPIEGEAAGTDCLRFSRPGYVTEQCARAYFQMWRDGHDQPLATLNGQFSHQLADCKGHWMYRMLRDRIGDAAETEHRRVHRSRQAEAE